MGATKKFAEIGADDVASFGGKNASLGEMTRALQPLGVNIPPGFATTAAAYRDFLRAAGLEAEIRRLLERPRQDVDELVRCSDDIRRLILSAPLPAHFAREIETAYEELSAQINEVDPDVAVRSSATAEDLPTASFAGQQETFLNVRGKDGVLEAVKRCFASLFTPRAINYREDMGFGHLDVALSVGVQKMVRSDLAAAGVIFTLDTESGHRGMVLVTSSWGLGENIVQGRIVPDQFVVHKEMLGQGYKPLLWKKLGSKEARMIYDAGGEQTAAGFLSPTPTCCSWPTGPSKSSSTTPANAAPIRPWTSNGPKTAAREPSTSCRRVPKRFTAKRA